VVPVLALAAIGLAFGRSTDPGAAKDRDAADAALLRPSDLGSSFSETEHASFARSRGGVRIDSPSANCDAVNGLLEDDGQAAAESVLVSRSGGRGQVVYEQVLVMGSPGTASHLTDVLASTVRGCLVEQIQSVEPSLVISLSPAAAPVLGDRALAFSGTVSAAGAPAAGDVAVQIVEQGRAVVILFTVDTVGGLGQRVNGWLDTLLAHLLPTFGA